MNVIEVSAGLVFRDGRLLITQRPDGGHLAGLWEFPGGKREPGESFEDCLRRELREELGLDIEAVEWIESITHEYPEKTVPEGLLAPLTDQEVRDLIYYLTRPGQVPLPEQKAAK